MALQLGEPGSDQVERLVPARGLELAGLLVANHRGAQTVGRVDEVEASATALDAGQAVVGWTFGALDVDDLVVLHDEVELAARAAVRAGGAHAMRLPGAIVSAALDGEGARRARLRAVAARLAHRRLPVLAERRQDSRAHAAVAGAQGVVARELVARADAALAADAQVGVVGEERVAVEDGLVFLRARVGGLGHAVVTAQILQLAGAVFGAREAEVRRGQAVVGDEQLQDALALRDDARRVGEDAHPVLDLRVAGRDERVLALELDRADAARADGVCPAQKAQRGNLEAGLAGGGEDRHPLACRDGLAVDGEVKHTGSSLLRDCRSRNGRSAGSVRTPARSPRGSSRFRCTKSRACARAPAVP